MFQMSFNITKRLIWGPWNFDSGQEQKRPNLDQNKFLNEIGVMKRDSNHPKPLPNFCFFRPLSIRIWNKLEINWVN